MEPRYCLAFKRVLFYKREASHFVHAVLYRRLVDDGKIQDASLFLFSRMKEEQVSLTVLLGPTARLVLMSFQRYDESFQRYDCLPINPTRRLRNK
jgi:hypothetical protein